MPPLFNHKIPGSIINPEAVIASSEEALRLRRIKGIAFLGHLQLDILSKNKARLVQRCLADEKHRIQREVFCIVFSVYNELLHFCERKSLRVVTLYVEHPLLVEDYVWQQPF